MKQYVYQVITDTGLVVFAEAQAQKASDYILEAKYDQISN